MNLLLTNVREDTAFLLVRSLRHEFEKIILAVDGDTLVKRWSGMARYSRFVSKSYRVPQPAADWWAGIIQPQNTDREENYISRIEEICRQEHIDVIFPSMDPEVYVFSKNKARFSALGTLVVTPDFDKLLRVQDKSLTLKAADITGFSYPRTLYPETVEDLTSVIRELEPPWVIKPRLTAHGANIEVAANEEQLVALFSQISAQQARPLVQEYIRGNSKQNYYLVVDKASRIISVVSPRVTRVRQEGVRSSIAACISVNEFPYLEQVQALVRELGLCGGYTLQTKIDVRDGQPKLMEINPRLGRNLWLRTELGVNEPKLLLQLAMGKSPDEISEIPVDFMMLDPVADLFHLLTEMRENMLAVFYKNNAETLSGISVLERDSVADLCRGYYADYSSPAKKIMCPLNRGLLTDPLPPLSRLARQLAVLLLGGKFSGP